MGGIREGLEAKGGAGKRAAKVGPETHLGGTLKETKRRNSCEESCRGLLTAEQAESQVEQLCREVGSLSSTFLVKDGSEDDLLRFARR